MKISLVHADRHDDGSPLDLTLVVEADQAPAVGDLVTVGGESPVVLQVVERDWPQDLSSVTVHLRDPGMSNPTTSQQKVAALTAAGWSDVGAAR